MKASTTETLSYVLKQHKRSFDEECSKLLDQRKQLAMVAESRSKNGNNLNNVRCETS
jgi:hypothetical protein